MTTQLNENTLILVADGEQAKLFRNTGNGDINLQSVGNLLEANGYIFNNFKGPAQLPIETSSKEKNEATFAKHIADKLYEHAHNGDFEKLILLADPQTLGQIRPSLHDEVSSRIVLEIAKTFTNSTIQDIETALNSEL